MILDWFNRSKKVVVNEFGEFKYEHSNWISSLKFGVDDIELEIAGDKDGLDTFAENYWRKIEPNMEKYWLSVIDFSLSQMKKLNYPFFPSKEEFVLNAISIYKENSFDRGHLAFWFDVLVDNNATYYVSFIDEVPVNLHRDT